MKSYEGRSPLQEYFGKGKCDCGNELYTNGSCPECDRINEEITEREKEEGGDKNA